jgi:hypothetical protein
MTTYEEIAAYERLREISAAKLALYEAVAQVNGAMVQLEDDAMSLYDEEVRDRLVAAFRWADVAHDILKEWMEIAIDKPKTTL